MSEIRKITSHSNTVRALAYSPDGCVLASGSYDKTVIIWDAKNRSYDKICTLTGHSDYVIALAFSPDGCVLASGSWDKTVIIWDAKNRSYDKIRTLTGHSDQIWALAYSPDGCVLASGSNDKTVIICDAKNRSYDKIRTLTGHSSEVFALAYSPDGCVLASGSLDKTVIIWDAKNRSYDKIRTLLGHSHTVWALTFSPDGCVLASGSGDGTVIIWDAKNRSYDKICTLTGHSSHVWDLTYSPDGCVLASGSRDKTVIIWDAKNCSYDRIRTLTGHSSEVWALAFSPDGSVLASGSGENSTNSSGDNSVRIWDVSEYSKPPKPPIPEFFVLMEQCQREKWSSWRTLEALADKVDDPVTLQLYYTAASAAYKLGDINKEERDKFISDVLELVPSKFAFDQAAHVVAMAKMAIKKARADGILDQHKAMRLDQLVENAHTFADVRFTGMISQLEKLQLRVDCFQDELGYIIYRMEQVENRITNVEGRMTNAENRITNVEGRVEEVRAYAENIDANLVKLKKQIRKHLKRKAAASSASAFLNIMTLGMASGFASAASAVCDSAFSSMIDLTDTKHVLKAIYGAENTPTGSELAQAFGQDKVEGWISKPLTDIITQPDTYPEFRQNPGFIQIAAVIQACAYIDAPISEATDASAYDSMASAFIAATLSDDASTLPPPPPSTAPKAPSASTLPTAATLGDAKATFSQLKEDLGLDDTVQEIPIDDDFMDVFQGLFDLAFDEIDPQAEDTCRHLIDGRNKGSVKYITWNVFYKSWVRSGLSMAEHLQSKIT